MGILKLYNHSLTASEEYVQRYCAGESSDSEDMHFHVLEHIRLLMACDETELWWGPHYCRRRVKAGLYAARKRGNPYLKNWEECDARFRESTG